MSELLALVSKSLTDCKLTLGHHMAEQSDFHRAFSNTLGKQMLPGTQFEK